MKTLYINHVHKNRYSCHTLSQFVQDTCITHPVLSYHFHRGGKKENTNIKKRRKKNNVCN